MNIDFQRSLTIFIMHYRPLISPRSPYQSCNLSWKYFYRGKPSIDQTSTLICHFCLPFLRHLTYFARFCMKWRHACFVTFDPVPPSRFSRTKAHCCHKIYDRSPRDSDVIYVQHLTSWICFEEDCFPQTVQRNTFPVVLTSCLTRWWSFMERRFITEKHSQHMALSVLQLPVFSVCSE